MSDTPSLFPIYRSPVSVSRFYTEAKAIQHEVTTQYFTEAHLNSHRARVEACVVKEGVNKYENCKDLIREYVTFINRLPMKDALPNTLPSGNSAS
jgi:hypothetical protein